MSNCKYWNLADKMEEGDINNISFSELVFSVDNRKSLRVELHAGADIFHEAVWEMDIDHPNTTPSYCNNPTADEDVLIVKEAIESLFNLSQLIRNASYWWDGCVDDANGYWYSNIIDINLKDKNGDPLSVSIYATIKLIED